MDQPPVASLRDHFASLTDPRVERTKHHLLLDIIVIAVCAVIGGADSRVEIEAFGNAKPSWFRTFLDLPIGSEISPFARMRAGCAWATARRIPRWCATSRATCYAKSRRPNAASALNASRRAGVRTPSSRSSSIKMQLPCEPAMRT